MGIDANIGARLAIVPLLIAMAAGCGGGGGGEPAVPAAPPVAPLPPAAQPLHWGTHPAASAVLGQANFSRTELGDLALADGNAAVASDGRLFVATIAALRAFDNYVAGGATAQLTLPFEWGAGNSSQGTKLATVAGERIYIFNNSPAVADAQPSVFSRDSLGCRRTGMNTPSHVHLTPMGHVIVVDSANSRVLIWNPDSVPSAGELPEPSVVVGQKERDRCAPNDTEGDGIEDERPSEYTLSLPRSAWSDGSKLIVSDAGNNRVLIWDRLPSQDFQPASWVVGQANFTDSADNAGGVPSAATLAHPGGIDVNEFGQLAVADSDNHRVLVWNAIPAAHSAPADHVVGQSSFTRNTANDTDQNDASDVDGNGVEIASSRSLSLPVGVRFHNRNLIVTDHLNNRVLVFPASN